MARQSRLTAQHYTFRFHVWEFSSIEVTYTAHMELETASSQRSESDVLESNPQGAAWMYLQADMAL